MPDQLSVQRVALQLREEILRGEHQPGAHLDEVALAQRLGVSRNGLREAFRLLDRDRLVRHEPHRGVFVRRIDAASARQAYEVRRHLECGGLREAYVQVMYARTLLDQPDVGDANGRGAVDRERATHVVARWDAGIERADAAVCAGEQARDMADWHGVGTANAEFHAALGALGGNAVLEEMLAALLGESRLRFLVLADARVIHEPFLADNRRILTLLRLGEGIRAAAELDAYLLRARALYASETGEGEGLGRPASDPWTS